MRVAQAGRIRINGFGNDSQPLVKDRSFKHRSRGILGCFFEYLSAVSKRPVFFFLSFLVLASCERWEDYRARWVGSFSGQVELHSQYPTSVGGNWIMFDTSYTQDWVIHVEMDGDSSLLMTGTRAGEVANFGTVQVPLTGAFLRQTGGGSSYAELRLQFSPDSLSWYSFNKCGIPCSSWSQGLLTR